MKKTTSWLRPCISSSSSTQYGGVIAIDGALENRNDGEMRSIYIDAAGNESGRETESGSRTAKKQSPRFSFKK